MQCSCVPYSMTCSFVAAIGRNSILDHSIIKPLSLSFINELLVSWDAQATASMLEDPFFKKELEKDKTYREKYGIKDDYMKRSLQVCYYSTTFTVLI